MTDKMSYKKCYTCSHSKTFYLVGGGIWIVCNVLGESLTITDCPIEDDDDEIPKLMRRR